MIALATASALLHIRAEYGGPRYQVYFFKPLTLALILLIAARVGEGGASLYRLNVIAGLVCSLAGDVFLMLPWDLFIAGLISFFIAHLFYITAFTSGIGFNLSFWSMAPLAILGVFMFRTLSPYLGKRKLPVLVYMVAILVMALQAWERWHQTGHRGALLAFLGAVLFLISDSALAVRRFRGEYRSAQALVLGTYFAAQCLIALSIDQTSISLAMRDLGR